MSTSKPRRESMSPIRYLLLVTIVGLIFLLSIALPAQASGKNEGKGECRGNSCNQGGGDVDVSNLNINHSDSDSESNAWSNSNSDSSSSSGSESSSDSVSGATSNNSVVIDSRGHKSTTVKNVVGPDTPNVYPSAPCRIARSAGLSIAGGALSGGSSVEDPECTLRETARFFQILGVPEVGLHLLCTQSDVINGRRDKKGNLEKGEPTPIGSAECLRLVRLFQGDDHVNQSATAHEADIEILREEHDRAESELLARVAELEGEIEEVANKPVPAPRVTQQTVQQPLLNDEKRAKMAALFDDDEEISE